MFTFHAATPDDADQIAAIVAQNSGGIVTQLLDGLIGGLSAVTLLSAAFMKEEGPYTTSNIICSIKDDRIIGLLFSYPSSEHGIPGLMQAFVPEKRIAPVRAALERSIPDSLYINTFWTEDARHADALMLEAQSRCAQLGFSRISLFCWNDNTDMLAFYARHGFKTAEYLGADLLPLDNHPLGGTILCKDMDENGLC